MNRDAVISRIRNGDALRMQYANGKRVWWFETPHQVVPDHIAISLITSPESALAEAGDSLFGLPLNSQTFLSQPERG